jgi:hypothetical protein
MNERASASSLLSKILDEESVRSRVADAREIVLASELILGGHRARADIRRMSRLGYAFESQGLSSYRTGRAGDLTDQAEAHTTAFYSALTCWLSVADHLSGAWNGDGGRPETPDVFGPSPSLSFEVELAFHVAATGLLADASAETRHRLRQFQLEVSDSTDWLERLAHNTAVAFALLVRKSDGWSDIGTALELIEQLRGDQADFEGVYLDQFDEELQARRALALVGYYHLAQMVTAVGDYLKTGGDGAAELGLRLDSGRRKAIEAFQLSATPEHTTFADLLWAGSRELVRNSLWSHIEGLPEGVQRFGRALLDQANEAPVLELWPSQQEALRQSFLDPYRRAIMVEMPTSAGKTLLAKFAIVQAKAFNDAGTIAYVVPTRALVNQVTFELRRDFSALNYVVEMAVPAFELDPSESRLLGDDIDVLVTTPEKLDLLIRVDHQSVKNLTLIVADEAHNLQDGTRGARLELLLGTIKRERRNARFLLLSPFLPNGQEIVTWLGEDRALPPIQVRWRPSRRIVGAVTAVGKMSKRRLSLEALPAADNGDVRPGTSIPIAPRESVPANISVAALSRATALALRERGGVLILCKGKGTAMKRAVELASELKPVGTLSPLASAVCEFIDAEVGGTTPLTEGIRRGVAYHHAGLSQETRWLVERLISTGDVRIVCGTTTLAQGVNFPISTVIVESLAKGDKSLSYSDFWNIAGRAGRALMDPLGVVAFPAESGRRKVEYEKFLQGEAAAISSQLAALIVAADEIGEQFNLASLRTYPELSALLQFLAHAVRVSDQGDVADQMENLLRSSLVYHQARGVGRDDMNKFIGLCRAYVRTISGRQKGLLALADKTGFATPSVFYLSAQVAKNRTIQDPADWLPSKLFGDDISALRQRVEMIAGVPEMRLGEGKGSGPFDATRAASILRDWVQGAKLSELAERYARPGPDGKELESDKKLTQFSGYLFSTLIGNASWGLGALEGLSLGEARAAQEGAAQHVPSMVYFGVKSTEAVWLRMAGVPRLVAEGTADIWRASKRPQPESFRDLRSWVSSLSEQEWRTALPSDSAISPRAMQTVWKELNGG